MNKLKESRLALDDWLKKARRATSKNNPKAPEIIASKILRMSPTQIATRSDQIILTKKEQRKLDNLLGKLLTGRPLPAVIHHTQFHNLSLKVNNRVLTPRAETEELIEYAIKNIPKKSKVLDIGTGTGAIGIGLAKARPDLRITLTDIDYKTLNLAKINARRNKITAVKYIKSNLIKKIDQRDLEDSYFLANLPYVNPNWKNIKHKNLKYEPRSALFASDNGLKIIKNLLEQISNKKLLNKNNWALLEHDPKQFDDLQIFCKDLGLKVTKVTNFVSKVEVY